ARLRGAVVTDLSVGVASRPEALPRTEKQGTGSPPHRFPGGPGARQADRQGAWLHVAGAARRERRSDGKSVRRLGTDNGVHRRSAGAVGWSGRWPNAVAPLRRPPD